jgi:peptidylprolyl isomerase
MNFSRASLFFALVCLSPLCGETSGKPLSAQAVNNQNNDPEEIKKLSKAFGHFIGKNLNNPGFSFDINMVIEGMRNGAAGKPAPMSDQEYEQLLQIYQAKAYLALSDENLRKASDFLAGNKFKKTVVEIEPGKLQYEILQKGTGEVVQENSSPTIHYTGKFIDGQTFGSTEENGEPVTLSLQQTIPGFKKGIVGMKEGEKRRLYVHPDLGYGTQGPLPPNSLLIFDVEVVKSDTAEDELDSETEDDTQQW